MKVFSLLLLLPLTAWSAAAQVLEGKVLAVPPQPLNLAPVDTFQGRPVYPYTRFMPAYPGGPAALQAFLRRELRFPPQYVRTHIEGSLFVAFIVDRNGQMQRPSVAKGLAEYCDAEALRVVRLLPPFAPGSHHGQPVDVRYVLALRFACDEGWSVGPRPRATGRPDKAGPGYRR